MSDIPETHELSRKEREAAWRRSEIIEAAGRLFVERGYEATSLHEIAEASEFSVGTLYNFFESKEDIYFAVIESQMADFYNRAKQALSSTGDLRTKLEAFARAYFEFTRNTGNKEAEAEYERLAGEVIPLMEELDDKAKRRLLEMPEEWLPMDFKIARKEAEWSVELFRESNLPLITEDIKYKQQYQKISSEWATEFDGKKMTSQQLMPFLESTDRQLRERAWRAIMEMHAKDYDKLNDLFDNCLKVRKQMARNADLPDFVEYQFRNYKRLSYDRHDGKAFRDAIKEYVVPAAAEIYRRRQEKLGLNSMRPWDRHVDPDGAEPPKIYEDLDDLKDKVARVLGSVDPKFTDAFRLMDQRGYLDLENRPNKAPGAYMNDFAEERISMIFSNFVGTSRDFDTLIHEGGHAMHGFLSRRLPYPARTPPLEFAEVASMSLELLARPYWDIVYNEEDRKRIGIKQLESDLAFLPFMAQLDEFQDWVYTHPDGEDPEKRAECWQALTKKYSPYMDYTGLEDISKMGWQYLHVYEVPLYYIEYGIAQVGAMQVFARSLEDYDAAVRDYKKALSLGNTAPLPELFETAGVKFVLKHPEVLRDSTRKMMDLIGLG